MEYKINDIVTCEVTGTQSYGAFIKLPNGEQGLIHISELSPYFVKNVNDIVKVGQTLKVKIIGIVEEKKLYRLSLKQVQPNLRQNVRQMRSSTNPKKQFKVPLSQQNFATLKANLDKWIQDAKKEYEGVK